MSRLTEVFDQRARNFAQESRGDGGFLLAAAESPAITSGSQEQPLLGARHADVAESPLFFHGGLGIERAHMREQAFLHASEEHDGELEALGVVQREQRDGRALVQVVGIGDQRGVIQELRDGFTTFGGFRRRIHQFAQVAEARFGFRIVIDFEHPAVTGAIENFPKHAIHFPFGGRNPELFQHGFEDAQGRFGARWEQLFIQHAANRRPHAQLAL